MIIKTYQAETMAAALKAARTELGSEAVILKSRSIRTTTGRAGIELTACSEKTIAAAPPEKAIARFTPQPIRKSAAVPPVASTASSTIPAQGTPSENVESGAELILRKLDQLSAKLDRATQSTMTPPSPRDLLGALRASGASEETIAALIARLGSHTATDESMAEALQSLCTDAISQIQFGAGDRVVVLGLPGAGKTSLIGRLAADCIFSRKLPVTLTTLDSQKPSSRDELQLFADLMQAEFTETGQQAAQQDGVVFFDTSAISATTDRSQLLAQLSAVSPTLLIVVHAATMRSSLVRAIGDLLPAGIQTVQVLTMTDLHAPGIACINLYSHRAIPLIGMTNQPAGLGGLISCDPAQVAELIFAAEVTNGSN